MLDRGTSRPTCPSGMAILTPSGIFVVVCGVMVVCVLAYRSSPASVSCALVGWWPVTTIGSFIFAFLLGMCLYQLFLSL